MAATVRVTWNEGEYDRVMTSTTGPVGQFLDRMGIFIVDSARRRCPRSQDGSHNRPAGYAADSITHEVTRDASGLHLDVSNPATTPDGYPYGAGLELGTVAHTIRSRGDYPLRSETGAVFGREVHHPGTPAYPHLRPALEEARTFTG